MRAKKENDAGATALVKVSENRRKHCTVGELTTLLGVSRRRVQQLAQEGALIQEETKQGIRYLLIESLIAYANYCKGDQQEKDLDKKKKLAEIRYKEAKAKKEEILLQEISGEMHCSDHVRLLFSDMIGQTRAAFIGLPGRIAMDCVGKSASEIAQVMSREIYDIMEQMAKGGYKPEKFHELVRDEGRIIQLEGEENEPE